MDGVAPKVLAYMRQFDGVPQGCPVSLVAIGRHQGVPELGMTSNSHLFRSLDAVRLRFAPELQGVLHQERIDDDA